MFYVDLNSDLGESFGNYTIGMDEEILQYFFLQLLADMSGNHMDVILQHIHIGED